MKKIQEIIGALLFMVIGLALTPTITSSTATVIADGNASAIVRGLVALVPVIYVVLVIVGGVAFITVASKK